MATAKQLAARKRFAEMARSGAFKKAAKTARKSTRKSNPYLGEKKTRIYSEQRDELEYFVQEKWSLGWHTVAGFTSLEMAKMYGEGMARRTGKTYRVVIPE